MKWWLSDRREQYAILFAKDMEVYWHEPIKPNPELIIKKSIDGNFVIQWSTYGAYFAVVLRGRVSRAFDQENVPINLTDL